MSRCGSVCIYPASTLLSFLAVWVNVFIKSGKFSATTTSNLFPAPSLFFKYAPPWVPLRTGRARCGTPACPPAACSARGPVRAGAPSLSVRLELLLSIWTILDTRADPRLSRSSQPLKHSQPQSSRSRSHSGVPPSGRILWLVISGACCRCIPPALSPVVLISAFRRPPEEFC